jgi:hypothetical protein
MTDIILKEMNKHKADGVDFVSIFPDTILGPEVLYSYSKKDWLASNRSYPKVGRRYWRMVDGVKTYID